MIFVIDSNVFFSALIRDSISRKIIFELNDEFLFPEYLFEEFKNHRAEIIEKSGLSRNDFYELVRNILRRVKIVKKDILIEHSEEALAIMNDIDEDDSLIIACALAFQGSVIWTEDKHFRKQDKIRVFRTKEMINYLTNSGRNSK